MFFLLHTGYNLGVSIGGSTTNLYIKKIEEYKFINESDNDDRTSNANHAYFKIHGGYQFNAMNNLDIKIEGYVGHDFGTLDSQEKSMFKPSSFFGVIGKGELDFYETYCLYFGLGLYCSYSHILKQTGNSERYLLPTMTWVAGGAYYLNDRISICGEFSCIGFGWGYRQLDKIKGITGEKTVYPHGWRIGVGINIHSEKLPFSKK